MASLQKSIVTSIPAHNWRTTASGVIIGVIAVAGELCDLAGVHVENVTNGVFELQIVLAGLGAMGIGFFARDRNVSSEGTLIAPPK